MLRTEETVQRRERIAGQWHETNETDVVLGDDAVEESDVDAWAVAVRPWPLGYRERLLQHVGDALGLGPLLQARGDRDCQFSAHVFIVYAMLQSFWLRNLKPALRAGLTLIGLARELDRGLIGCRAPWCGLVARAP